MLKLEKPGSGRGNPWAPDGSLRPDYSTKECNRHVKPDGSNVCKSLAKPNCPLRRNGLIKKITPYIREGYVTSPSGPDGFVQVQPPDNCCRSPHLLVILKISLTLTNSFPPGPTVPSTWIALLRRNGLTEKARRIRQI